MPPFRFNAAPMFLELTLVEMRKGKVSVALHERGLDLDKEGFMTLWNDNSMQCYMLAADYRVCEGTEALFRDCTETQDFIDDHNRSINTAEKNKEEQDDLDAVLKEVNDKKRKTM